jgi:hypothetical protein
MQRRTFVKSSLATAVAAALPGGAFANEHFLGEGQKPFCGNHIDCSGHPVGSAVLSDIDIVTLDGSTKVL